MVYTRMGYKLNYEFTLEADNIYKMAERQKKSMNPLREPHIRANPLVFLWRFTHFNFNKYFRLMFKIYSLLVFFIEEFTIIICFYSDTKKYLQYVTVLILKQPDCVGLIGMNFQWKDLQNLVKTMLEWEPYDKDNIQLQKLIKRDKKIVMFLYSIMGFFLITSHLFWVPIIGDEKELSYTYVVIHQIIGNSIIEFIYACSVLYILALSLWIPLTEILFVCYNFKFQFFLLNQFFADHLLEFVPRNEKDHRDIYENMKICLIRYRKIKSSYRKILSTARTYLAWLFFTGYPAFTAALFLIVADITPSSRFRIYPSIIAAALCTIIICSSLQLLTDESMVFYNNLYNCPWYYWDLRCQKLLLSAMSMTSEPIILTFYNIFSIDLKLLLLSAERSYKFCAIAMQLYTSGKI